jgi:hypothetical protein
MIAALIFIGLSGCETTLKNAADFTNAAIANDQIQSGQVGIVIKSAPLSDTERLMIDHALNEYIAFADRWKALIYDLDSTTPAFAVFAADYNKLVAQYRGAEKIVTAHWEDYPEPNRHLLLDYQSRAERMNDAIDNLIAAGHRYQAMLDAITLAKILAGVALRT